ncbi:hypothetical protein BH11ACT5_BH11ACT5_24490 [soil metagenome]
MTIRFDPYANAAYISIGPPPETGESTGQVFGVCDPRGLGEIILDFDAEGHLIGVEVLGAGELLRSSALAEAELLGPPEPA